MEFRKAYDYMDSAKRNRVDLSFLDEDGNPLESMTQQHMKAETDINYILSRYDKTGLITHINKAVGEYGDFTEANEYQEALNRVINAQDAFAALPSDIRKRFGNDPGAFFEFATDPKNEEEMVKMGLAEAPAVVVEPAPVKVSIVEEPSG